MFEGDFRVRPRELAQRRRELANQMMAAGEGQQPPRMPQGTPRARRTPSA
jgi:hypothetical protein